MMLLCDLRVSEDVDKKKRNYQEEKKIKTNFPIGLAPNDVNAKPEMPFTDLSPVPCPLAMHGPLHACSGHDSCVVDMVSEHPQWHGRYFVSFSPDL